MINGVASVTGSVFVVYASMRLGFGKTMLAPLLLYLAVACWDVGSRYRTGRAANVSLLVAVAALILLALAILERDYRAMPE